MLARSPLHGEQTQLKLVHVQILLTFLIVTIQNWIAEMAVYVKSIDSNHMLEVGLEGFYGESVPERKQFNPGYEVGTDYISNNKISEIDFATIHAYPDQW